MHLRPLPFPARALSGDAHVWCLPAEIKSEVTLFEFAHHFRPPAGAPPFVAAPRKEGVEQWVAEQQLVQQIEHDQYGDRDQRAVPMADQ
jgi:hypothetical protein